MAKKSSVPDDPKASDQRVRITDFAGMSPGTDLHDNDPGESWYQVNVVPFHPGELRVRRGFVVCQFETGPTGVLVAPPLVRYADATSSVWMHSDSRRGRDINVAAWQSFSVEARQPVSNWPKVDSRALLVMTGEATQEKD